MMISHYFLLFYLSSGTKTCLLPRLLKKDLHHSAFDFLAAVNPQSISFSELIMYFSHASIQTEYIQSASIQN